MTSPITLSVCNHTIIYNAVLTMCMPDDPVTFKNAPVNVQVVARTLEEEAVIAMAEIVDAALTTAGSRN